MKSVQQHWEERLAKFQIPEPGEPPAADMAARLTEAMKRIYYLGFGDGANEILAGGPSREAELNAEFEAYKQIIAREGAR